MPRPAAGRLLAAMVVAACLVAWVALRVLDKEPAGWHEEQARSDFHVEAVSESPSSIAISSPTLQSPRTQAISNPVLATPSSEADRKEILVSSSNNHYYSGPQWRIALSQLDLVTGKWGFIHDLGGWPVCEWKTYCVLKPPSRGAWYGFYGRVNASNPLFESAVQAEWCRPDHAGTINPHIYHVQTYHRPGNEAFPALNQSVVWLPGTTLIADSFIGGHYGHVIQLAVQTWSLVKTARARNQNLDRVLWIQETAATGPPQNALQEFMANLTGDFLTRSRSIYRKPDLADWGLVCMERAVQARLLNVRMFYDSSHLAMWMNFRKKWNPSKGQGLEKCPKDRVVVLRRVDGTFDRSIVNFPAMVSTMRDLGICHYENVSFGASASLAQQTSVFESYGLLFSVHSAQLTNVVFAHPLSATLELMRIRTWGVNNNAIALFNHERAMGRELRTLFCVQDLCPTLFNVSFGHAREKLNELRGPVYLDLSVFKSDLAALLYRQREALVRAGCPLPEYLKVKEKC